MGLLRALWNEDASKVVFCSSNLGDISVGQVRALAIQIVRQLESSDSQLFVFTRSAAAFCAAFLAAAHSKKSLIILPQSGADYLKSIGVKPTNFVSDAVEDCIRISWEHLPDVDGNNQLSIDPDYDVEMVFFTSGSSGVPKQIFKTASVIEAEADVWKDWFGDDISHIAGSVSHQHIYGLIFRVALPLMARKISQDDMALSWEALMEDVTPKTLIVSSPAHLTRLPEKHAISFTQPAFILSSGGLLPTEACFATAELFGVRPLEILGSTETGGVAYRQRTLEDDLWTPVSGVVTSVGEEGELRVTSPFIPDAEPVKMGDRVEFGEDGRFQLLGRIDRIVKVEGKRVSLPRVEDVLSTHPLVSDCAVFLTMQTGRERLSGLVCLTQEGQLKLGELGAFKFSRYLRKNLSENLEAAEWPKRMRFVSRIPTNSQSKRVLSLMQEVFEGQKILDLLAPTRMDIDGFEAKISFKVSPNLPWFEGHFKDNPILPGLAQTHMAARLSEEIWAVEPASFNVNRMKFQQVIQPHEVIDLELKFKPDTQRLTFAFTRADAKVSSGTIG
ncbi:AMP-binding protein [Hirschia litorea]|uniref:Long-chain-fatty-acid--CoA ligase n=1 Tax=Hirschia litorea TaxID=1199156 RepID=A0ABW2IJ01_9PROT